MGLYFKGKVVSNERIVQRLGTDNPEKEYIGNLIWVWKNPKSGATIITGDEGNSWSVILAEGDNKEEAMAKFKLNREKNGIFTELSKRVMKVRTSVT